MKLPLLPELSIVGYGAAATPSPHGLYRERQLYSLEAAAASRYGLQFSCSVLCADSGICDISYPMRVFSEKLFSNNRLIYPVSAGRWLV
jgi:hypothetical protein